MNQKRIKVMVVIVFLLGIIGGGILLGHQGIQVLTYMMKNKDSGYYTSEFLTNFEERTYTPDLSKTPIIYTNVSVKGTSEGTLLLHLNIDLNQDGTLDQLDFYINDQSESWIEASVLGQMQSSNIMGSIQKISLMDYDNDGIKEIGLDMDLGGTTDNDSYYIASYKKDVLSVQSDLDYYDLPLNTYEIKDNQLSVTNGTYEERFEVPISVIKNSSLFIDDLTHETFNVFPQSTKYKLDRSNYKKLYLEKHERLALNHKLLVLGDIVTTYELKDGKGKLIKINFRPEEE